MKNLKPAAHKEAGFFMGENISKQDINFQKTVHLSFIRQLAIAQRGGSFTFSTDNKQDLSVSSRL